MKKIKVSAQEKPTMFNGSTNLLVFYDFSSAQGFWYRPYLGAKWVF